MRGKQPHISRRVKSTRKTYYAQSTYRGFENRTFSTAPDGVLDEADFFRSFYCLDRAGGPDDSSMRRRRKTVKLTCYKSRKVEVQVYTIDHNNSHKADENKRMITPGGQGSTQATVDSGGYIDITFSILGKNDKNVSEYHCTDVKTSVGSKTELQYDVSMSGRKC